MREAACFQTRTMPPCTSSALKALNANPELDQWLTS
jgi:hypothetical protein